MWGNRRRESGLFWRQEKGRENERCCFQSDFFGRYCKSWRAQLTGSSRFVWVLAGTKYIWTMFYRQTLNVTTSLTNNPICFVYIKPLFFTFSRHLFVLSDIIVDAICDIAGLEFGCCTLTWWWDGVVNVRPPSPSRSSGDILQTLLWSRFVIYLEKWSLLTKEFEGDVVCRRSCSSSGPWYTYALSHLLLADLLLLC